MLSLVQASHHTFTHTSHLNTLFNLKTKMLNDVVVGTGLAPTIHPQHAEFCHDANYDVKSDYRYLKGQSHEKFG
jgi:hypothetical protein